jgi:hypothetical protein
LYSPRNISYMNNHVDEVYKTCDSLVRKGNALITRVEETQGRISHGREESSWQINKATEVGLVGIRCERMGLRCLQSSYIWRFI